MTKPNKSTTLLVQLKNAACHDDVSLAAACSERIDRNLASLADHRGYIRAAHAGAGGHHLLVEVKERICKALTLDNKRCRALAKKHEWELT